MNNICFGMPVLAELPDLEAHTALCAKLGLAFVELNMNFPMCQIPVMDIRKYQQIASDYRIGYTLHLDEQLDVCSFNRLVARAWQDTVLQSVVLAKQLDIPVINMHMPSGIRITLPGEQVSLYARHRDSYLFHMRDFRNLCVQVIGDDAILICVENQGIFTDYQTEAVNILLESECFGLTYDIGHDYVVHNACEAFIMSRADRLKHMHIHDATRSHNHLTLGTGDINLDTALHTANRYGCRCVIETKTVRALTESVTYLSDKGYIGR